MAPVLGYWKLRGLAQHTRLLLEYTGTEYEEKLYVSSNADEWFDEKFSLGLDFPNLPYYIDGDVKLTQSTAILRHIARQNNLLGKDDEEARMLDVLENEAVDLRQAFSRLCYHPDFENLKDEYLNKTLPMRLEMLSKFLGNNNWFLGDKISYVDFIFYESLDVNLLLSPSCLDKFENLQKYLARFEALEPIKKYLSSGRFIKYPLNGPMAMFGGK